MFAHRLREDIKVDLNANFMIGRQHLLAIYKWLGPDCPSKGINNESQVKFTRIYVTYGFEVIH